jgi:TRAP-type C4-dicarboxylate transport system permease small subunit
VARVWHAIVRALEICTGSLFAVLVLDVLWGVLSRYWPGIVPSDWTEELGIDLLVWVSLLASTLTYREHGHLGVDYLVAKFDPAAQRATAIVVDLSVAFFAAFVFCYGGYLLVAETLASGQLTPVLQWKAGYVYLVVPVSGVFFLAFAIEHLLRPMPRDLAPAQDPSA